MTLLGSLSERQSKGFDAIGLGEVLLRLSPVGRERIIQGDCFEKRVGGSEFNVISTVSALGGKTALVTKLPDNEIGSYVIRAIHDGGVSAEYVVNDCSSTARLGLYYFETGSSPRKSSVIYDRRNSSVNTVSTDEINPHIYKNARVFHTSGITLALCENMRKVAREMMLFFKKEGAIISFDVNFRASLWSEAEAHKAITDILPLVDILFVSEESSRRMFKKTGKIEDIMKSYSEEFGCRLIATTSREAVTPNVHNFSSRLYSCDDNMFYSTKPYRRIEVVDRVGSGDAFVGGVLYALLNGYGFSGAAEYGNACSTLKSTIVGDLPAFNKRDIDRIITAHNSTDPQSEMNR